MGAGKPPRVAEPAPDGECIMKSVRLLGAVIVTALSILTGACGANTPTAPSTQPPANGSPATPPAVVYAPPPAGVSAEVWRVGFSMVGAKLRRPEGDVNLVLPEGTDEVTRVIVAGYVEEINRWRLQTHFNLGAGGTGVTIPMFIVPGLLCSGEPALGCMTPSADEFGRINGKKIEFSSVDMFRTKAVFLHEAIRCLGIEMSSPKPGLTSNPAASNYPTTEELAMLLGRYQYPLLSVYSPQ